MCGGKVLFILSFLMGAFFFTFDDDWNLDGRKGRGFSLEATLPGRQDRSLVAGRLLLLSSDETASSWAVHVMRALFVSFRRLRRFFVHPFR